MYCKYCGAQISDDARFCQACGRAQDMTSAKAEKDPFDEQEKAWGDPTVTAQNDSVDLAAKKRREGLAIETLTWGIVSLALTLFASFFILGFIFSFIAKKKANQYETEFGESDDIRVRLGRIFGTISFIMGLVLSIIVGICLILFLFAIGLGIFSGLLFF